MSSNLAANILIERLDARKIQVTNDMMGAVGMRVLRGVNLDDRIPVTNTFRSIVDGSPYVLNPANDSDKEMHKRLRQRVTWRELCEAIGIPPGIAVAHKTGEITKIQHDAALVFAARPFALVVLVRGLDDVTKGSALAADITRVVFTSSQSMPDDSDGGSA